MSGDKGRERRTTPRRTEDKWSVWDKRLRDAVIFLVGVSGVVNEVFLVPNPRPSILLFLGSLIGVPFVLSADENRSGREDGEDEQ